VNPRVLVVGAGPAGLSAALWCRSFGLPVDVVEGGPRLGGQLHRIYHVVENYPGLRATGAELVAALEAQAAATGLALRCGRAVAGLEPEPLAVRFSDGERERADRLVVATGTRPRTLGVPGEAELTGRGVYGSATRHRGEVAGVDVVVAGGGDAAYENALLLAEAGCRVTVAVRGAQPRARQSFRDRVESHPAIRVLLATRVDAILGDDRVRAVRLAGPGGASEHEAAAVFVKAGVMPNTEWCGDVLAKDAEGYLVVGESLRTSHARIWAAGDVTRPALPSLAHAVGDGARAAAEILRSLEG
jgi:thioredoxin reductase (NADPH)